MGMNRAESTDSRTAAAFWAAPLLLGLVLVFGGTLVSAALLSAGVLGEQLSAPAVYVPLALGALAASFWGARRAPAHRLPAGLLCGGLLLGCLFVLGLTVRGAEFSAPSAGLHAGITFAASLLGALSGAAGKQKKRRRA